jgi:solute carrier family 35 protein E1
MSSEANGTSKFPAFSADYMPRSSAEVPWKDDLALDNGESPRTSLDNKWGQRPSRWNGNGYHGVRHGRQKSLSEAIRTIRTRTGSISQNALEIADALKAPVSPVLVVCRNKVYRLC